MDNIYMLTMHVHIGVINSGRHNSPHIKGMDESVLGGGSIA